jgi:hypothetical protein
MDNMTVDYLQQVMNAFYSISKRLGLEIMWMPASAEEYLTLVRIGEELPYLTQGYPEAECVWMNYDGNIVINDGEKSSIVSLEKLEAITPQELGLE